MLGVGVSAINLSQAAGLILEAVRQNRRGYVAVTGVHGVNEAQSDPEFRRILNAAFLNTPDGMPMSWVGRLQGAQDMWWQRLRHRPWHRGGSPRRRLRDGVG